MLMGSKPWAVYWFSEGQKKLHLNLMREIQLRETSTDTERIKYKKLTESKAEVQKTLIYSKSREGTDEFSGAIRFSNTFVEVQ